ncbi:ABC transporter ATP-binding protein, partial [Candidatus Bipolaricaulota bacterium]|nr:ABC transporter ATP-binding protein [Candidatus Bipolaricaulota bacterium]
MLGMDLAKQPIKIKAAIGHVYANMAFYSHMSALDNLTFLGRLYGLGRKRLKDRVRATLDFVELWDERKKRVGAYSQGMKQRLGIARALIHEPKILLFDEATNGIDVQGVNDIRDMVYQLRSENKTILIASHQLGEIELVSDSIGLLKSGRLVAVGTPHDIKTSLNGILYKYVIRVPQPIQDFGVEVVEKRFVKDCNIVLAATAVETQLAQRFGADLVEVVDPTLEEAFLWMLGTDHNAEPSVANASKLAG